MKKHILITGSTDGIGKEAAVKSAGDGHHLYLHGRNSRKLEAVIAEVKTLKKNDRITGFVADFSDLKAVKRMAGEIRKKVDQLDVLINNAGVYKSPVARNAAGLDMRFAVNYLAPFVLTAELLPLLKKAKGNRIINLSSAAQATVSIAALKGEKDITEQESYAQSKLALTMWSIHMAKVEKDLTVIAVNPGSLLNTNMVREAFGRHWAEADKGAIILHELAVAEVHGGMSGKYYDNDKGAYGPAHSDAYDDKLIDELTQATRVLLN